MIRLSAVRDAMKTDKQVGRSFSLGEVCSWRGKHELKLNAIKKIIFR